MVELSDTALRKVVDVNIISYFILLQEFLPSMTRANHSHIVTVDVVGVGHPRLTLLVSRELSRHYV